MDNLVQDLRYTIRSLVRQPSFALTAILTLALGIGATTTMFGVVNAVILQPLPFRDADKVVAVTKFWTKTGVRSLTVSAPDSTTLKREATVSQRSGITRAARPASRSAAWGTTQTYTR